MVGEITAERVRLGAELRDLRLRHYPSGSALARRLGWGQPKLSKLERGAQLPTEADLDVWVAATSGDVADRDALAALLADARASYRAWGDAWRTPAGIVDVQRGIAAEEKRASMICEYQPAMLPGLVQTPAYARALLASPGGAALFSGSERDVEGLVVERVRRQELLYDRDKRIRVLLGEAALHTRFGDGEVMAGQWDRLLALSGVASVEMGVLPFERPHPLIPVSGFSIIDDRAAIVESLAGEQTLTAPADIASFTAAFEAGMASAVTGDELRDLVRRVADGLRPG
ncbi:helix-turn-helix domain-containing protein [Pseudonocardia sp. HH130630-07]|uniref:helix-turn-helix domain-containing protein n=1 Tax=Pseudonocardia sp. HH130630-07 TaxID=1690815 RepID=UPI000815267C|nr:helix-turn-helix transcriptional regulator [Pseudonocardia sp. HH130630-07]ANY08065.1 hypothetical protein AFB00_19190 [Pseudonocardia sp. HH130630-07]